MDHIGTVYTPKRLLKWYGIDNEEAISLTRSKERYSTRKLYIKLHDFRQKHRRFWSHYQTDLVCSLCRKCIPRYTFFHGPSQTCVFLKCCYNLVHLNCHARIANNSIDHCRNCFSILKYSLPDYTLSGFYFGQHFHLEDRIAKKIVPDVIWSSTHEPIYK